MWSQKVVHLDFVAELVHARHGPPVEFWAGYDNRDGAANWTTSAGEVANMANSGLHVLWATAPTALTPCATIVQTVGG